VFQPFSDYACYTNLSVEPPPNVQSDGESMQTSSQGDTSEEYALPGLPIVQGAASLSHTASVQPFTPIKTLGEGAFSTVWLCDWHRPLPPNAPLSTMQSVVGIRPEYKNMRLVAVKRMKKKWTGSWEECRKLKELEVCVHPLFSECRSLNFLVPTSLGRKTRYCWQYPLIQMSFPCTIHFFSQRPRSSA